MNYAICRVEKIKTVSNLKGRLMHNYREKETPNANSKIKNPNSKYTHKNGYQAFDYFHDRMNEVKKPRKDSVVGLEYMLTSDKDYFDNLNFMQKNKWIKTNIAWLEKKHRAENIVSINIHLDETTPHIQAIIIPEAEGKLNAKKFTGGVKMMRELQDEYSNEMQPLGLVRGIKKSKATHRTIQEYYTQANQTVNEQTKLLEKVSKKGLGSRKLTLAEGRELAKMYKDILKHRNDYAREHTKLVDENRELTGTVDQVKKEVDQVKKELEDEKRIVRTYGVLVEGLKYNEIDYNKIFEENEKGRRN